METPSQNHVEDPELAAHQLLQKENQEFENHWVWRKLGCRPQEFFQAFEKHVRSLNIPQDKWNTALTRAQEANRIQCKEKKNTFNPLHFQMMAGVQV